MKRYRLLKDLPDCKAGTILTIDVDDDSATYDYTSSGGEGSWYRKQYVENNPEWFAEIPDTPEQTTKEGLWSDEDMIEFAKGAVKVQHSLPNEVSIERGFYHFKKEKAHKQSLSNTPVFDAEKINQRIDQLTEMEEAFNAARERKYIKDPSIRIISDFTHDFQYKTFSNYLSSIKKQ